MELSPPRLSVPVPLDVVTASRARILPARDLTTRRRPWRPIAMRPRTSRRAVTAVGMIVSGARTDFVPAGTGEVWPPTRLREVCSCRWQLPSRGPCTIGVSARAGRLPSNTSASAFPPAHRLPTLAPAACVARFITRTWRAEAQRQSDPLRREPELCVSRLCASARRCDKPCPQVSPRARRASVPVIPDAVVPSRRSIDFLETRSARSRWPRPPRRFPAAVTRRPGEPLVPLTVSPLLGSSFSVSLRLCAEFASLAYTLARRAIAALCSTTTWAPTPASIAAARGVSAGSIEHAGFALSVVVGWPPHPRLNAVG